MNAEELRAALDDFEEWPDADSGEPWQVVMVAAKELLTIREAGALIITPDDKTVDAVARAIARSSRQSWDDSARHVLDALRDAMPDGEP